MLLDGATAASWSSIASNDSEFHLLILAGATRASCSGITSTASALHLMLLV